MQCWTTGLSDLLLNNTPLPEVYFSVTFACICKAILNSVSNLTAWFRNQLSTSIFSGMILLSLVLAANRRWCPKVV